MRGPADQSGIVLAIEVVHTDFPARAVGQILAPQVAAWVGWFRITAVLSAIIVMETGILAVNHGRSLLQGITAKVTAKRPRDFHIYCRYDWPDIHQIGFRNPLPHQ